MSPEHQMSQERKGGDAGVVPYTPSRMPAIIEEAAQVAAIACIIITALSGEMMWLAPTLPMLVVAAICERVRAR